MKKNCVKYSNLNDENTNFCIHCGFSYIVKCEICIFTDGYCNDCGKKEEVFSLIEEVNNTLACVSDIGRHHLTNQDYVAVKETLDGTILMVVADGVSNASNSEEAAKLAVENTIELLNINHQNLEDIEKAVLSSHNKITQLNYVPSIELAEPMCTIVVAMIKKDKLYLGWVGDSRAYLFNESNSLLLTRDDSWVSDAMDLGISEVEALKSIHSHEITQCLGTKDETPEVRLMEKNITIDDFIMVCSDGLWNYFNKPEEFKKFLSSDTLSVCKKLVSYANQCGGRDNISVAIKNVKF